MPWRLFHYTLRDQLEAILSSGQLVPAGSMDRFGGALNYRLLHNAVEVADVLNINLSDFCERTALADREPAAVWCSTDPVWETTVGRYIADSSGIIRQPHKSYLWLFPGMLARIEVDATSCPISYEAHLAVWGVPDGIREEVRERCRWAGVDPNDWRLSYEPIPRSRWLGIHVWDGKRWALPPPALRLPPR